MADTLSRAHSEETGRPCEMEEIHQTAFEAHLERLCGLEDANLSESLEAQIEQAMKKDRAMITLKEIIIEGWPNRKSEMAPEVRMY